MRTHCLRNLRLNRGITQNEISNSLHVSRPVVSRWENGISRPTDEQIAELADMFCLRVEDVKYAVDKDREYPEEDLEVDNEIAQQITDIHLTLRNEMNSALKTQEQLQEEFNEKLLKEREIYSRRLKRVIIFTIVGLVLIAFLAFGFLLVLNYKSRQRFDSEEVFVNPRVYEITEEELYEED